MSRSCDANRSLKHRHSKRYFQKFRIPKNSANHFINILIVRNCFQKVFERYASFSRAILGTLSFQQFIRKDTLFCAQFLLFRIFSGRHKITNTRLLNMLHLESSRSWKPCSKDSHNPLQTSKEVSFDVKPPNFAFGLLRS